LRKFYQKKGYAKHTPTLRKPKFRLSGERFPLKEHSWFLLIATLGFYAKRRWGFRAEWEIVKYSPKGG